jgi:hypothetical protein
MIFWKTKTEAEVWLTMQNYKGKMKRAQGECVCTFSKPFIVLRQAELHPKYSLAILWICWQSNSMFEVNKNCLHLFENGQGKSAKAPNSWPCLI